MFIQRIALARSGRLAAVLAIVHAGAAAAVWLAPAGLALRGALSAAILASLAFHLVRDAALAAPQSIVMLEPRADGRMACLTRRGEWLECVVLPSTYVSPQWTVINLRPQAQRGFRPVIIVPGAIAADDFRRLRAWLRWKADAMPSPEEGI